MAEDVGIGSRAGFYEGTGAARDVLQNHLLQLLALTAMDEPVDFEADSLRTEKRKVLGAISARFTPEDAGKITVSCHSFPVEIDTSEREGVDLRFYPDLALRNSAQRSGLLVKRAIDFLGSLVGLVLFLCADGNRAAAAFEGLQRKRSAEESEKARGGFTGGASPSLHR